MATSQPEEFRPEPPPLTEVPSPSVRAERTGFWRELPVLVVVALTVAVVIKTFLVQAFYIPSASMEPTLLPGDRVLVNKLAYRFGEPSPGDIVVFDSPFAPDGPQEVIWRRMGRHVSEALGFGTPASEFIKRVVAVPGDTVELRAGVLHVNGEPVPEPYLSPERGVPELEPETVPPGHVFVMGDNRDRSQDSRVFGPIPLEEVVGKAFVRVWPPPRWAGL